MDQCPECSCQLEKFNYVEGWLHCYCPQCHFSHDIPTPKDDSVIFAFFQKAWGKWKMSDDPRANFIIKLFLVCVGASIVLGFFPLALFGYISAILRIVALVTIVTGFIKCPQSRAIKVLFWITMAIIVLVALAIIVFVAACVNECANCARRWP